MPARRKYLDLECAYIVESRVDIQVYCACGHSARLPFERFAAMEAMSLFPVIDRLRCKACGVLGDVPEIRVTPRDIGPRRP